MRQAEARHGRAEKGSVGGSSEPAPAVLGLAGVRMLRPPASQQNLVAVPEQGFRVPVPQGRVAGAELAVGPGPVWISDRQSLAPHAPPLLQKGPSLPGPAGFDQQAPQTDQDARLFR